MTVRHLSLSRSADVVTRTDRADRTLELFRRAAASPDPDERTALHDQIVVLNLPLAGAIASRYRYRGVDDDDLSAVANLALVRATHRFDVGAGHLFASFASPTIHGELKRYFRDNGWMVRPPRRIQEIQAAVAGCKNQLNAQLGHSPRPSDLAEALSLDVGDVEEALSARGCFTPASLDLPLSTDDETTLGDMLVHEGDSTHSAAEARAILGPLVRQLAERDRRVLQLRFFEEWTQSEIAADIGVTQMQVSRLIARILFDLKRRIDDDAEGAQPAPA